MNDLLQLENFGPDIQFSISFKSKNSNLARANKEATCLEIIHAIPVQVNSTDNKQTPLQCSIFDLITTVHPTNIIAFCVFLKGIVEKEPNNGQLVTLVNAFTGVFSGKHLLSYQTYIVQPLPILKDLKIVDFCTQLRNNNLSGLDFISQTSEPISKGTLHTNQTNFAPGTITKEFMHTARKRISLLSFTPDYTGTINLDHVNWTEICKDTEEGINSFQSSYHACWKGESLPGSDSGSDDQSDDSQASQNNGIDYDVKENHEGQYGGDDNGDIEDNIDHQNQQDNLSYLQEKSSPFIIQSTQQRSSSIQSNFVRNDPSKIKVFNDLIKSQITVEDFQSQMNLNNYQVPTPLKSQQKINDLLEKNQKEEHKSSFKECLDNPLSFKKIQDSVAIKLTTYEENLTNSQVKGWWLYKLYIQNININCKNQFLNITTLLADDIVEERAISCASLKAISLARIKAQKQVQQQAAQNREAHQDKLQQEKPNEGNIIQSQQIGKRPAKSKTDVSDLLEKQKHRQQFNESNAKPLSNLKAVYKSTVMAVHTENFKKCSSNCKVIHVDFKPEIQSKEVDPVYVRFALMLYPVPCLSSAESMTINKMMNSALLLNDYVQSTLCPQDKKLFTGTPFFDSQNYRLMNCCHAYQVTPNTEKFRNFQSRNQRQAFNDTFIFKPEIQLQEERDEYLDQLMGVANILCDGLIYVERRSFTMLLAGLLKADGRYITNKQFLNPLSFPFTAVMNMLVFDFRLSQYDIKLMHIIHNEEQDLNIVPSFTAIFYENKEVISEWVQGNSSVVVELCYFNKNEDVPKAQYVVIRENTNYQLEAMSMKRGIFSLPQWYSINPGEKMLVSNLIDELFCSDEFKVGQKLPFLLRFYQCKRLPKPKFTVAGRPADFMPRARDVLVRYFSMYNVQEFQYCVVDLMRGEKYLLQLIDQLPYEQMKGITFFKQNKQTYDYIYSRISYLYPKERVLQLRNEITRLQKQIEINTEETYFKKGHENFDPWYGVNTFNHLTEILEAIQRIACQYNDHEFEVIQQFFKEILQNYLIKTQTEIPEVLHHAFEPAPSDIVPLQGQLQTFELNYEIPYDLRINMINSLRSQKFPQRIYKKASIASLRRFEDSLITKYFITVEPLIYESKDAFRPKSLSSTSKVYTPFHQFDYVNLYEICFFKELNQVSQALLGLLSKPMPVTAPVAIVQQDKGNSDMSHLEHLYYTKLFNQTEDQCRPTQIARVNQNSVLAIQNGNPSSFYSNLETSSRDQGLYSSVSNQRKREIKESSKQTVENRSSSSSCQLLSRSDQMRANPQPQNKLKNIQQTPRKIQNQQEEEKKPPNNQSASVKIKPHRGKKTTNNLRNELETGSTQKKRPNIISNPILTSQQLSKQPTFLNNLISQDFQQRISLNVHTPTGQRSPAMQIENDVDQLQDQLANDEILNFNPSGQHQNSNLFSNQSNQINDVQFNQQSSQSRHTKLDSIPEEEQEETQLQLQPPNTIRNIDDVEEQISNGSDDPEQSKMGYFDQSILPQISKPQDTVKDTKKKANENKSSSTSHVKKSLADTLNQQKILATFNQSKPEKEKLKMEKEKKAQKDSKKKKQLNAGPQLRVESSIQRQQPKAGTNPKPQNKTIDISSDQERNQDESTLSGSTSIQKAQYKNQTNPTAQTTQNLKRTSTKNQDLMSMMQTKK